MRHSLLTALTFIICGMAAIPAIAQKTEIKDAEKKRALFEKMNARYFTPEKHPFEPLECRVQAASMDSLVARLRTSLPADSPVRAVLDSTAFPVIIKPSGRIDASSSEAHKAIAELAGQEKKLSQIADRLDWALQGVETFWLEMGDDVIPGSEDDYKIFKTKDGYLIVPKKGGGMGEITLNSDLMITGCILKSEGGRGTMKLRFQETSKGLVMTSLNLKGTVKKEPIFAEITIEYQTFGDMSVPSRVRVNAMLNAREANKNNAGEKTFTDEYLFTDYRFADEE